MKKIMKAVVISAAVGVLVPINLPAQSDEKIVVDWLRQERASLMTVGNLKLELYLQKQIGQAGAGVRRNLVSVHFDPANERIVIEREIYLDGVRAVNKACTGYLNEVRRELGIDSKRGAPRFPYESKVGDIYVPPELLTVKVGRSIENLIWISVIVGTDDSEYACAGNLLGSEITRL